ncbi:MAG: hypothetical protein WC071_03755 [Victivallaceae bacterium]
MIKFIRNRREKGQILSEYAVMLAMCAVIAVTLMVLFYYFSQYGWRLINLVSIDYP